MAPSRRLYCLGVVETEKYQCVALIFSQHWLEKKYRRLLYNRWKISTFGRSREIRKESVNRRASESARARMYCNNYSVERNDVYRAPERFTINFARLSTSG